MRHAMPAPPIETVPHFVPGEAPATIEGPLKTPEGSYVYRCVTPGILTAADLVELARRALALTRQKIGN